MSDAYQPRLTWKSHSWRLAFMLLLSAMGWLGYATSQWHDRPWLFWIDVGIGVLSYVLVHLRRRNPLLVTLTVLVLSTFSLSAAGPVALATVSLATRRKVGEVVALFLLGVVAGQAAYDVQGLGADEWWQILLSNIMFGIAFIASGMYIGSRRELVWTLRERAETAEREQDMRVSQARLIERERIAREMHDVLAHRISLVSMHAGALAYRTDLSDPAVRQAAEVINDNAHQALADLRSVLGILRGRQPDHEAAERTAPQPTYVDIATLVGESRDSGIRLDFTDEVDDSTEMPVALGRTVYRIVQEVLTNVRKHASSAVTTLHLHGDPNVGITIETCNPIPPGVVEPLPTSGLGLVGVAERVELAGGKVEHSLSGQRFHLRAWLPWTT